MIDTMALAKKIARWNTELSTAPIRIKADLDEALLAEVNNERRAVVDFIRAIARDVSTDSRASEELFRGAKSIEAGFHRVIR